MIHHKSIIIEIGLETNHRKKNHNFDFRHLVFQKIFSKHHLNQTQTKLSYKTIARNKKQFQDESDVKNRIRHKSREIIGLLSKHRKPTKLVYRKSSQPPSKSKTNTRSDISPTKKKSKNDRSEQKFKRHTWI